MKEHLSTLIIALLFVFGLLAIDSVRGAYAGFTVHVTIHADRPGLPEVRS